MSDQEGLIGIERRMWCLAREAIRCALAVITGTSRHDDRPASMTRAQEALREFRDALDPQALLDLLDGRSE